MLSPEDDRYVGCLENQVLHEPWAPEVRETRPVPARARDGLVSDRKHPRRPTRVSVRRSCRQGHPAPEAAIPASREPTCD